VASAAAQRIAAHRGGGVAHRHRQRIVAAARQINSWRIGARSRLGESGAPRPRNDASWRRRRSAHRLVAASSRSALGIGGGSAHLSSLIARLIVGAQRLAA